MIDDYIKAKRFGEWAYRKAVLSGQYPYLTALDDLIKDEEIQAENYIGQMEIPLEDIVGTKTKGRQQAFSYNFMPLLGAKTEFAAKWIALYDAALEEGIRDAITVYEYMGRFYVEEGNKRVSVSRINGAVSILANVTRILPKRNRKKENKLYYEFVDFFRVCPVYGIYFSDESSYQKLATLFGMNLTDKWPEEVWKNLHATFARFSECIKTKFGDKSEFFMGDAYLTYIQVYGYRALLLVSTDEINQNLQKLHTELQNPGNEVQLVEKPSDLKRDIISSFLFPKSDKDSARLTIGFIYEKNPDNSSWAYGHELGRNSLEEKFRNHIETVKYENCDTQDKITAAIDDAVKEKGCDIVFTTTGLMAEASLKAAVEYPNVKIMNCSVHTPFSSIRTYYGRMYEAKFLMGALAAASSESDDIGYVELCPLYGTVSNINAFAIGAGLINPKARVHLEWSALKDTDWRENMRNANIRIISGPEMIKPKKISREFGLYEIEGEDVIRNLATPVFDWGKYYELIIHSVQEGSYDDNPLAKTHQALNYWFGLDAGVVDVFTSGLLSYSSRKLVGLLKQSIISGQFRPFDGEVHSQNGIIHKAGEPRMTSDQVVSMNWLNENVVGTIPEIDEFIEPVRELIRANGFLN